MVDNRSPADNDASDAPEEETETDVGATGVL